MNKSQFLKKILKSILYTLPIFIILLVIFLPLIIFAQPSSGLGLVGCEGFNCNMTHFMGMIMRIINYAIRVAFAFVGIIFAYAGYTYMTAQGDSGKVSKAHGMFTKAAVGLFITLSAFLIVQLIMTSLEVKKGELIIEIEGYVEPPRVN